MRWSPDEVAGGRAGPAPPTTVPALQELDAGEAAIVEGGADHFDAPGLGGGADDLALAARHHEAEQGRGVGEELVDHVLAGEPGGRAQPLQGARIVRLELEDAPEPHVGIGVPALAEEVLGLRQEHVDA